MSGEELAYVKKSKAIQDHLKSKWKRYKKIGNKWRKKRVDYTDVNIVDFIMNFTNDLGKPIHRLDIKGLHDKTGDPEEWLTGLFARMLLGLHKLDKPPT